MLGQIGVASVLVLHVSLIAYQHIYEFLSLFHSLARSISQIGHNFGWVDPSHSFVWVDPSLKLSWWGER